jgi:hypothetical protein
VLGYAGTDWGGKKRGWTRSDIDSKIRDWYNHYGTGYIDGIFFDEGPDFNQFAGNMALWPQYNQDWKQFYQDLLFEFKHGIIVPSVKNAMAMINASQFGEDWIAEGYMKPGSDPAATPAYGFNLIVAQEQTYADYMDDSKYRANLANGQWSTAFWWLKNPDRICHTIHSCMGENDMIAAVQKSKQRWTSYVYVFDKGPNPPEGYDHLPPYWTAEVQEVSKP